MFFAETGVVSVNIASHSDATVFVHHYHVLIRTKSQSHDEGVNVDWVISLPTVLSKTIAQPHERVDLGLGGRLLPGRDHQEGSHSVAIDGKIEEFVGRIHTGLIESVGTPQIEPVLGLEQTVHCWPDVKESHLLSTLSRFDRGIIRMGFVSLDR